MTHPLPDGLYDQLLTNDLALALGENIRTNQCTLEDLDATSGTRRLAEALADQLVSVLQDISPRQVDDSAEKDGKRARLQGQLEFVNTMLVVRFINITTKMCYAFHN